MESNYKSTPEQVTYVKVQGAAKWAIIPIESYQLRQWKYTVLDWMDSLVNEQGRMKDGLGNIQRKLPIHMVLSQENPYSSAKTNDGIWYQTSDGVDSSAPSEWILKQPQAKQLRRYFDEREQKTTLIAPQDKIGSRIFIGVRRSPNR